LGEGVQVLRGRHQGTRFPRAGLEQHNHAGVAGVDEVTNLDPLRRGVLPAPEARMRLVYTVRFERNGAPMAVTGAPTEFGSPWREGPVPVREVQTVVKPGD
jgi:hypothetical protein